MDVQKVQYRKEKKKNTLNKQEIKSSHLTIEYIDQIAGIKPHLSWD